MSYITESLVEFATLDWFEQLDYTTLHGLDIAPDAAATERQSYADIVLIDRLSLALERINPKIPSEAIEEAAQKVIRTPSPSLFENNRRFHTYLSAGVDVEYQADGRVVYDQVKLIDFDHLDNNDWLVVNQFTVIEDKKERRPDVVVFINGLPVGVIELKNPGSENATIRKAFDQLQTYKQDIPSLFPYNEILVVSDGTAAKVGTLTADWERFMPWRFQSRRQDSFSPIVSEGDFCTPESPTSSYDSLNIHPATANKFSDEIALIGTLELEVLILGIFEKHRFLDLLRHFIVFEVDGADITK